MKKIKNGFFITVEGIDGSGKSSIVQFLSEELSKLNFNVIKTREPGGTSLGTALRNIIITQMSNTEMGSDGGLDSKSEFLLFAADRAQHVHFLIKPALIEGALVISDRGADSSLAYQGYGKGLDLEVISSLNSWIMNDTKPNLTIYLKIDYQTAIDRVIARGEKITSFEEKGKLYFDKVIDGFNQIFDLRAKRQPNSVLEIDATKSAIDVKKEVLDKVLTILASMS